MRWNLFLVTASIVMLLFFIGVGLVEHMAQADAITEELAPQIGIDEDIIRRELVGILRSQSVPHTVVYCSPLALLSILLVVRLIADIVKDRRGQP